MAIFFQDMNQEERAAMTMAMVNSGDKIDLSQIKGVKWISTRLVVWEIRQH